MDELSLRVRETVRHEVNCDSQPCAPYTNRLTELLQRGQAIIANAINVLNKAEAWKNVGRLQKLGSKRASPSDEQAYMSLLKRQAELMHAVGA